MAEQNFAPAGLPFDVRHVAGARWRRDHRSATSGDLPEATVVEINAALLAAQGHLLPRPDASERRGAGSVRQAARRSDAHPTVPKLEGTDYVLNIKSDGTHAANTWHTDVTFVDAYPQASILRAVVPAVQGRRHGLGQHRRGL